MYRADGPDVLPALENTDAMNMRRIACVVMAKEMISGITRVGSGQTRDRSLQQACLYHCRPNACTREESRLEAQDFVASWFPGGLNCKLDNMGRDEIMRASQACSKSLAAHEARYRKRLSWHT